MRLWGTTPDYPLSIYDYLFIPLLGIGLFKFSNLEEDVTHLELLEADDATVLPASEYKSLSL